MLVDTEQNDFDELQLIFNRAHDYLNNPKMRAYVTESITALIHLSFPSPLPKVLELPPMPGGTFHHYVTDKVGKTLKWDSNLQYPPIESDETLKVCYHKLQRIAVFDFTLFYVGYCKKAHTLFISRLRPL